MAEGDPNDPSVAWGKNKNFGDMIIDHDDRNERLYNPSASLDYSPIRNKQIFYPTSS